jgi:hypothetical protein
MHGAFTVKTRRLILDRDDCSCALCGILVANPIDYSPLREYSLQHRRARGAGGSRDKATSSPANGVVLCGDGVSGDHGYVETHPQWALSRGYRVPQGLDPATVPLWHHALGWVLLTAAGGVTSQAVPFGEGA